MRYYPINLDINGHTCLVVGGGPVGLRKVTTLLECGARVTVVSPEVESRIEQLAEEGRIRLERRAYTTSDLDGKFLVIGATDDNALNRKISWDAGRKKMLCNIADVPDACNFILPSIVHRGDLIIAISTSGSSPAMAKKLRRELEIQYGEEYGDLLSFMQAVRRRLLSQAHAPEAHKPLFEKLLDGDLVTLIRKRDVSRINALLADVLGEGYDFDELMEVG